ncbi:MAG: hypothetical protein SFV15_05380 [Polyangiaceae bacterium]|nr:hypothetical protein [Polyangiaceae bacterium]
MTRLTLLGLLLTVSACSDGGGTGTPMGSSGGTMGTTGGKGSGGSGASSMGGKVGSGGATGSGGLSGAARGAVSIHIIETPGCSLMDQYQDFPIVPGGRPVTAAGVTKMLEHGTVVNGKEVRVACSIRGAAPPYQVLGQIRTGVGAEPRLVDLGALLSVGIPGVDSLVLAVPDLPDSYAGAAPEGCTYTATELDPAAGRVVGSFVCGTLQGQTSKDPCKVGESYFAFENCSR